MTAAPAPDAPAVAAAESKLATLGVQIESMQTVLVRLMQDAIAAEARIEQSQAAQLVEANEQLMLAALASRDAAETAAQALEEAEHASVLDPLTHLPTRATLHDRFAQAAANARRRGTRFALLFVDLDHFKPLNDSLGHAFGDQVLRAVAARLVAAVREADTVSRHGGDEFLVLLGELHQPADAQAVAEKLIAAIAAPLQVDGHTVQVTASVGIAMHPEDGEDVDTLVAHADAAMYASKRRRAGGLAFHGRAPVPGPARSPQVPPPPVPTVDDAERRIADLREANERLVLAALSAGELQAAAEKAQQRQAALLAAVAAELQNPAAPIRIAGAVLGRDTDAHPLLPRVQDLVGQQLAQMSRLIGQLLDAHNLQPGGLQLQRQRVEMADVVAAVVAGFRPTMARHRLSLELRLPAGPAPVLGDAGKLRQILGNLLDNACRYTPDGGRISLVLELHPDELVLTLADKGIGITREVLPHVFEPFVQDTLALGLNGGGLGIGLTVALALAQAHGGTLTAHSDGPRRGSRFVLTLPLPR